MKLTKTETTSAYPHLRCVSENGVWEMGIAPITLFGGHRIAAEQIGSQCYEINYCAGTDKEFALQLLAVVFQIMECLPEDVMPGDFRKTFPDYTVKPINLDPCWQKLNELLEELRSKHS